MTMNLLNKNLTVSYQLQSTLTALFSIPNTSLLRKTSKTLFAFSPVHISK